MFSAEVKKLYAKYKIHFIQYTLFMISIISIFIYGFYFKIYDVKVNNYERLTILYALYYIIIIRFFSAGFVNVYNEFHQGYFLKEILYNETISKISGLRIVLIRAIIRSFLSLFVTYSGVVCVTVILGINFSYINYFIILLKLIIGSFMLWGIALIYCSLCMLFNVQKSIALFFELFIVICLVIFPLEYDFIPTNMVKASIYNILMNDIIICKVSNIFRSDDIFIIIISALLIIISILCFRISEWIKMKRGIKLS